MHTDDVSSPGADAIVASAKARGVPVVHRPPDADLARRPQRLDVRQIAWSNDTLSFRVGVGAGATGLRGMVPAPFNGKALRSMTRDGSAVTVTRETIKGVEYAFFAASAGQYAASYEADTTAPRSRASRPTAATDGTATVTWTTDEAADSRVDYGTSAGSPHPERDRRRRRDRPQHQAHRAHGRDDLLLPRALRRRLGQRRRTAPDTPASFKTYDRPGAGRRRDRDRHAARPGRPRA